MAGVPNEPNSADHRPLVARAERGLVALRKSASSTAMRRYVINRDAVRFDLDANFASNCSPDFASSIIAPGDEFVALFVKGTICQRQNMCTENLK